MSSSSSSPCTQYVDIISYSAYQKQRHDDSQRLNGNSHNDTLLFKTLDPRVSPRIFTAPVDSYPLELLTCFYQSDFVRSLDVTQVCSYCGHQYTERNNIGLMHCRYHPGRLDIDHRWSCCHQPEQRNGCIICDCGGDPRTNGRWNQTNRYITIPTALRNYIRPYAEQIVTSNPNINPVKATITIDRLVRPATLKLLHLPDGDHVEIL